MLFGNNLKYALFFFLRSFFQLLNPNEQYYEVFQVLIASKFNLLRMRQVLIGHHYHQQGGDDDDDAIHPVSPHPHPPLHTTWLQYVSIAGWCEGKCCEATTLFGNSLFEHQLNFFRILLFVSRKSFGLKAQVQSGCAFRNYKLNPVGTWPSSQHSGPKNQNQEQYRKG